jgi:hypothetical protein
MPHQLEQDRQRHPEQPEPVRADEVDEDKDRSAARASSSSLIQAQFGRTPARSPDEAAQQAAADAVQGGGGPMPHAERIQDAFGKHDVSGIVAHTGPRASEANAALGAEAFAVGNNVAFAGQPDLHTAAHEAAHVVQQRSGMERTHHLGAPQADPLESHADHVADAVVSGRSAEPILDQMAASASAPAAAAPEGAVQLRKKQNDTSFVGGESEQSTALAGPTDQLSDTWFRPGQGGYAERLQGATVQVADTVDTQGLEMQPVEPVVHHIDKHITIANAERDYYDDQRSWMYSDEVSHQKIWVDRRNYADGKAQEFQTDKDNQQANFQSYNAFVPLGNSLIGQLTRIAAQKQMLGITDDQAMKTALIKGLEDAAVVGRRAKDAYSADRDENDVEAPKAQLSVEGSLSAVREKSVELDAAYVNFQRVLLDQEITDLKDSGADEEARMKEINQVKSFLKGVGGQISNHQQQISGAAEKVTNAITDPVGTAVGAAEKGMELLGDFIYYEEVQKLQAILDSINARINNKKLAKEFREVLNLKKTYNKAMIGFARSVRNLQRALHDRRVSYRKLGTKLDRFSQNDAQSRKEGRAAGKGGDRYATMLSLVVEIRQAVALARFAKDGLPPLSGDQTAPSGPAPNGPDAKAPKWASWANGVIDRRNSYASWIDKLGHPRINMPADEQGQLQRVYEHLHANDTMCRYTIEEFDEIDSKAGELMNTLGGMSGV